MLFFKRIKIRSYEIGMYFRDGEFKGLLREGRHWLFDLFGKVGVDVVSQRDPWLAHDKLDMIVKSSALKDCGLFDYDDWKAMNSRVKLLVRGKSNLILQPIQRLADGSYLAKIYPSAKARRKDQDGIVVRVIEYTIDVATNDRLAGSDLPGR